MVRKKTYSRHLHKQVASGFQFLLIFLGNSIPHFGKFVNGQWKLCKIIWENSWQGFEKLLWWSRTKEWLRRAPLENGEKYEKQNRCRFLCKCVGCGEMKNKKEMLRVLKTPEDEILLDTTGRKNGRGAYLCQFHPIFRMRCDKHFTKSWSARFVRVFNTIEWLVFYEKHRS